MSEPTRDEINISYGKVLAEIALLRNENEELTAKLNKHSDTCSFCKWTNTGCLNIADVDQEPKWICHGCIKQLYDNWMKIGEKK